MIDVLCADDVKRQDAEAAARGLPVERLMENAGFAVARAARRMLGGCYGRRVVVVCGKGNNAGDGLVAGRVLRSWGAHVTAVLVLGELGEHAARQRARFDGRVVDVDGLERELSRADLVIDAIFGVGLTRAPERRALDVIGRLSVIDRSFQVLSVDVPSGMDADTGRTLQEGFAVRADATVTLGGLKPGLLFRGLTRRVEVADIGTGGRPTAFAPESEDVARWWPVRWPGAHKRSVGTVLVVAGSRAMPGAAVLVTGAAVHGGAGLTVLCAPEDVCRIVLSRVPEITTIPVPESSEGTTGPKALDLIRPRLDEFHAIAIGPGLTTHPATVEFVRALVAEASVPVVLDADGLNAFAGATEPLLERSPNTTVLTPHGGELARLVGGSTADLEDDRLRSTQRIAAELGCVLVFKGPGTVTSARMGNGQDLTFVNPTGGEVLAQGGTGDVLTGLLAAGIAQLYRPVKGGTRDLADAIISRVAAGVWLHGRAADRIAARLAPHPANASALVEELGPTIHEVAG